MRLIELIPMPLTVAEYQIGQIYSTAEMSKAETGGGDGVQVVKNEPFTGKPLWQGKYEEGQYTKKIYVGKKKVSGVVRTLAPESAFIAVEESWNAYPYCRTILNNEYMEDNFEFKVETIHLPGRGDIPNAHKLAPPQLKIREIVKIDITADVSHYKESEDPCKFQSAKTKRGPLAKGRWMEKADPVMTCYKLVTIKFKWFGLQSLIEEKMAHAVRNLMTQFNRRMFCWMDKWIEMTMADVRAFEKKTNLELKEEIKKKEVKGTNHAV